MGERTVDLVLSGGGARAIAHAGVWRALEEAGLRPRRIVGTSMGAVVGAGFAAGMTYAEVLTTALAITRRDVAALSPLGAASGIFARSLLRSKPLKDTIARLVRVRRFDALELPLTITAVDLASGALQLFGEGGVRDVPLIDALYASCALPVYYPPFPHCGREYGDGGLRETLPLGPLAGSDADLVVAVDVGPTLAPDTVRTPARTPPLLRAHDAAVRVLMAQQIELSIAAWRHQESAPLVLIRPVRERHTTFAIDRIPYYVEQGYRAARRALNDLRY